ncbi:hypothetical protein GOBAR_AA28020 [Gossypium barbadense]|uniref:Uncharacterized protein n=1 Tax=Gossypium barbadense TaxID=3634 RepID=A0A2P5WNJ8_GOSBA|nr:hypothetical protein GOBAR_AA28020 [Gossypium barbadense]
MTTSTVYFSHNLKLPLTSLFSVAWRNQPSFFVRFSCKRKRFCGFVANAENDNNEYSRKRKTNWWGRFFFEDEGNWLGLKDDDMVEEVGDVLSDSEEDEDLLGGGKFEAWKRRAEAIIELRQAQEDMRNEESRRWEDWIVVADGDDNKLEIWLLGVEMRMSCTRIVFFDMPPSIRQAKFLAALLIVPLALDLVVHDFVLMPFLDYVKTVPLAAEILDVRRNQKLEMVKQLQVEKARFRFEVEIGKSPPLSDEELWWELRRKA